MIYAALVVFFAISFWWLVLYEPKLKEDNWEDYVR
jgi:hypothetical protein